MFMPCLAPMDGVTDKAFRYIVRQLNPDVWLFSEFTNIHRIYENEAMRIQNEGGDQRYIVQIIGNEPDAFAKHADALRDFSPGGVNINMGCPAKKIAHSQHGSALMKDVSRACRIIEKCAESIKVPISVKTRLGWKDAEQLISFSSSLESSGLSLIIVHGRTYEQKFKGEAYWDPIYHLKKQVKIPVIGNGDVAHHEDGIKKLKNLDGYMIGRAAYGNPWVFMTQAKRDTINLKERLEIMLQHYELSRQEKQERRALIEFRKHLSGYLGSFDPLHEGRKLLLKVTNEKEFFLSVRSLAS